MNFNYLHIDETSIGYKELLDRFVLASQSKGDDQFGYYNGLANYVKILMNHFYSIIVRNLREFIPKTLGQIYIKPFKQNLRFYLLCEINRNIDSNYLEEDPEVARKRNHYINLMKILKNSEKVMLSDEE
jgi:hypothetical protein